MSGENLSDVMPLAWTRGMVRRDVKVRELDFDFDFDFAVSDGGARASGE